MTPANCILLNVKGKYYYAEEFGKFIEIEEWEYHRVFNNPNHYYFSTALKKHFEWCAAVGKAKTLTFLDALDQPHSVSGSAEGESVLPAEPNEPSLETGNATRKLIAFLGTLRETIERSTMRLTKWMILSVAIAALTAFVGYNSRAPNHNAPSDSTVAQPPEIRRAIPVEPEILRAIPVEPEIRKAVPVQISEIEVDRRSESLAFITLLPQEEEWCHKEIQLHKWDHWTDAGKTFMIGVFREPQLGARKLEVDAVAKQIGARFYRMCEHHKLGNLEEVKVVFYK